MAEHQDRIDQLNRKLEALLSKQEHFAKELMALYKEIEEVKKIPSGQLFKNKETIETIPSEKEAKIATEPSDQNKINEIQEEIHKEPIVAPRIEKNTFSKPPLTKGKSNWEKFVGENLINKIGIVITIIGVVIGGKYSIENNLISPLTRIILGYLTGLGLLGFGMKLKSKYGNYSAVLVGGALAILYFITFAAHSFYGLLPQLPTFSIMLLFTIFGVITALNYNKQVIAHIGLVGAYAIPFLLSDGSGNAMILFGYMAIINTGILVIAFKKNWKPLYYASFLFTWLIFGSWMAFSYKVDTHFQLALVFLSLFFAIFYVTFLAYKLKASEKFRTSDILLVLLNSFIFYGFAYGILSNDETGREFLGLFTLGNALVHFVVSTIIFKKKLADRNLFYLIAGLVLVFITIAIPVQLDGNWVTLLWSAEAALLFWIGRSKNVAIYEYLSYPLMILAFFSLLQDWNWGYSNLSLGEVQTKPLLNINFMTSVLFLVAFGFINWINTTKRPSEKKTSGTVSKVMSIGIPGILLVVLYGAFYLEIGQYWSQLFQASEIPAMGENSYEYSQYNYDIKDFGKVWLLHYTLLFLALLAFANIKKLKNRILGIVTLALGILGGFLFLTTGLYTLSELRESYIDQTLAEFYEAGSFSIGIRYVAFAFFALLLLAMYKLINSAFMKIDFKIPFELLMHISILWVASSELLNWMDIAGSDQTYKLGLSILWGSYSLLLIALGIWKNKKYLRIGAIVLFGITLLKLFFYDIVSLNTISKTIVFVSLGILLLIISFLYNKYKHIITDEEEN